MSKELNSNEKKNCSKEADFLYDYMESSRARLKDEITEEMRVVPLEKGYIIGTIALIIAVCLLAQRFTVLMSLAQFILPGIIVLVIAGFAVLLRRSYCDEYENDGEMREEDDEW